MTSAPPTTIELMTQAVAPQARAHIRRRLRAILSSNMPYIRQDVLIAILRQEIYDLSKDQQDSVDEENHVDIEDFN